MATKALNKSTATIQLPVSLEQIAEGLRNLSRRDLITLELLLDPRAMAAIKQSLRETARGKTKPFSA